MKKFLNILFEILESMGKAKAAAHLTRSGKHKEAKALMMTK
jgi:hypothetical protein